MPSERTDAMVSAWVATTRSVSAGLIWTFTFIVLSQNGWTALILACIDVRLNVIKALLAAGSDKEARDEVCCRRLRGGGPYPWELRRCSLGPNSLSLSCKSS